MSHSEETIWDPISSLGRVMPPSDIVLDSSRSSFSQTKKSWPEGLLPRPSTPQTLTHVWNLFSPNFPFNTTHTCREWLSGFKEQSLSYFVKAHGAKQATLLKRPGIFTVTVLVFIEKQNHGLFSDLQIDNVLFTANMEWLFQWSILHELSCSLITKGFLRYVHPPWSMQLGADMNSLQKPIMWDCYARALSSIWKLPTFLGTPHSQNCVWSLE